MIPVEIGVTVWLSTEVVGYRKDEFYAQVPVGANVINGNAEEDALAKLDHCHRVDFQIIAFGPLARLHSLHPALHQAAPLHG